MQTNRYNSTGFAPTNIPSKSVHSYTDIPDNIKDDRATCRRVQTVRLNSDLSDTPKPKQPQSDYQRKIFRLR